MTWIAAPSHRVNSGIVKGIALAALLAASPLAAAPLCHDLKGLFTPCPPETIAAARRQHHARFRQGGMRHDAAPATDARAAAASDAPAVPDDKPTKPAKPPLFGQTKLCHDLKGLFTPCPR